jgi:hypothetical protein
VAKGKREGNPVTRVRTMILILLGLVLVVSCVRAAAPAPVPFGPGERMDYRVSVSILGSPGKASMQVAGIDTVRGHPTYQLRFELSGGTFFAKVDDRFRSWLDTESLIARRFEQKQHEVKYRRDRVIEFYPAERRWVRSNGPGGGDMTTDEPLDEVSFLYFVRTLPLEVGETYTFDRYFRPDGNPVILRVLRRETVEVPAGTFKTIVVRPIIRTGGLFREGGEAEVYFTDDERRILVQMTSKVSILGHIKLQLISYRSGVPLDAAMDPQ